MNTIFNEFRTQKRVPSFTSNTSETRVERARITDQNDSFETTNPSKKDKSNNGKFDISEAGKNLAKGIISPITAMIKHPIATIGVLAGTIAATTLVPVLGPVMAIGFGAVSLYQVGKGTFDAAKNYKNGNYDDAEKSFDKIGQGLIGTVMTALGMKQSAKIANEAKAMSQLKTNSLTHTQRSEIAARVDKNGFFSAVKDNIALVTTKKGLKSVANQFKPSAIKTRFTELVECFKGNRMIEEEKEVTTQRKVQKEDFKKTPEGIRRAALTDEQVEQEVNALYNEAFDKLGIPKEQRPNLKIEKGTEKQGGSYCQTKHQLEFNPESYKAGTFEIEDVMMHEATHCKEALLRAGIPQDRANQIVKEQLISRIMNGESEQVLVKGNFLGADMMTPPKMSPQMKQDFIRFAETELYQNNINSDLIKYNDTLQSSLCKFSITKPTASELSDAQAKVQQLLDKLSTMIKNNPEFASQYTNQEEALAALTQYSVSHNVRYNIFSNTKINKGTSWSPDYVKVEPLTGEKLAQAEQSLVDNITTVEGNGRISGINGLFTGEQSFNQYQFSPEEVLAQKNGNNFVIEKFTAKIAEMRANGSLTPQEEARLTKIITKAQKIIEYKTKGLDYYKQYTQMINNPNDVELAQNVKMLEQELNALKSTINPEEYETITEVIKVMTKTPDIATTIVPKAVIYNLMNLINSKSEKVA